MPPAQSPDFPGALHQLAALYPASSYLPVHDREIEAAARLARDGSLPLELDLVAPPYETVRLCNDKWAMHQWLRAQGLPSPETALATPAALARMKGPVVLKLREGSGALTVPVVRGAGDLTGLDPERWLLQEQLKGHLVSIDVFVSRTAGRSFCACREYFHEMKVRVFQDSGLAAMAERFARSLPVSGSFLIQVMQDAASRWQIIDVNPRIGNGTRMSVAAGLDFAGANLADHWGEPTEALLRPLDGDYHVVRQYVNYVTARP